MRGLLLIIKFSEITGSEKSSSTLSVMPLYLKTKNNMIISDAIIVSNLLGNYKNDSDKFHSIVRTIPRIIHWGGNTNKKYGLPHDLNYQHNTQGIGIMELPSKSLIYYKYDNIYTIIKITH